MTTYDEGKVYKAKIVDQTVVTREGEAALQLVLTVRIHACLKNAKVSGEGVEVCPLGERETLITIVPDNPERLRMAVKDLERLGFNDEDISRLHPEHKAFVNLEGREVHVRMKIVNENEYWNLVWPRETVAIEALKATAALLKPKIAAAKLGANGRNEKGTNT